MRVAMGGVVCLDILVLDGACLVLFYFWFWLILSFLPVVRWRESLCFDGWGLIPLVFYGVILRMAVS